MRYWKKVIEGETFDELCTDRPHYSHVNYVVNIILDIEGDPHYGEERAIQGWDYTLEGAWLVDKDGNEKELEVLALDVLTNCEKAVLEKAIDTFVKNVDLKEI